MKNWRYILLTFILGFSLPTEASQSVTDLLKKVDESLARRPALEKQKNATLDSLRTLLRTAGSRDVARRYDLSYQLYDEYKAYCYDSAYHYATGCLKLAQERQDPQLIGQSTNAVAFCLISAGIMKAAYEVLAKVDPSTLQGRIREDYYERMGQFWRSIADFVHEEPYYTEYITTSNKYLDSLIAMVPERSERWWSYKGTRYGRSEQPEEALAAFRHVLDSCGNDLRQRAMTTAEMAWTSIALDDEDKALEYFAESAIADNESNTREITALYHLARLVYKRGDYERASAYVHQALADVNFYNTRLRKVEINDILPIIEQDRYEAVRSQRNWFVAATILSILLILGVLWGYSFVRRKNQKLTEARATIAGQLEQLQQANLQLKEADKIKTAYIGRSFYINAEYIAKVEKLYLTIERKIAARQYDDLRASLKQSTLNVERESMYESFDQTFLKLFPDFVERYNALFDEKDRKMPPNDHSLTSEMRIFALIRLGITDSERIAKFLDYSVHTVNTYKTRVKNRSTAENDQFETLIMAI